VLIAGLTQQQSKNIDKNTVDFSVQIIDSLQLKNQSEVHSSKII